MASQESVRRALPATSWLGVGVVGIVIFLLGIYTPALARFAYSGYLQVTIAILGGATAVVGFTFWWDARGEEREHPPVRPLTGRAREMAIAPSLEVYRPDAVRRLPAPGESDDEDD
ncbi:MAG TPA: hypothetical protein VEY07_06845 [Thermoplasmata archaeon]|nr:hypothetical protein [Thermoplasmata archaeon]